MGVMNTNQHRMFMMMEDASAYTPPEVTQPYPGGDRDRQTMPQLPSYMQDRLNEANKPKVNPYANVDPGNRFAITENLKVRGNKGGYHIAAPGTYGTSKDYHKPIKEHAQANILDLGAHAPGTDFSKISGHGRSINPYVTRWETSKARKLKDKHDLHEVERAGAELKRMVSSRTFDENPWGEGNDAQAAKLAWEKQFLANDKDALHDYTQLQIRQHGAVYARAGDKEERERTVISGGREREEHQERYTQQFYSYKPPTNDLSEIDQYKMWRYDMRYLQTNKAIGSGQDDAYNPVGLLEEDKFQPTAFIQEGADFAASRTADRSAKQSGKTNFTKAAPKGVQL